MLDLHRFPRELLLACHDSLQTIEGVQDADRKCRTRTEPGARRQVALVMQLDALLDVEEIQRLAHGGVLDLLAFSHELDLRPDDPARVLEEGW